MFKKITIVTYILLSLNFNSFADENQKSLKVGLLAPFSGEYKDMGQSIMLSLQLALDEINDDNIKIFPRDSGFNNPEKYSIVRLFYISCIMPLIVYALKASSNQDNKYRASLPMIFISLAFNIQYIYFLYISYDHNAYNIVLLGNFFVIITSTLFFRDLNSKFYQSGLFMGSAFPINNIELSLGHINVAVGFGF